MLMQKPMVSGEVVTLKLITGEEVFGRLDSEDDHYVTLCKVCTLGRDPNSGAVGLMNWMMTSAPELVPVSRSSIITMVPTEEKLARKYTEETTSIQLV